MANPNVSALLTQVVPSSSYGTCLGVSQTFGSMARVIGPLFYAYVFQNYAIAAPFYIVAWSGIVALVLWLIVRRQKMLLEQAKEVEEAMDAKVNEKAETIAE